jgi:hypothetical protein
MMIFQNIKNGDFPSIATKKSPGIWMNQLNIVEA